MRTTGSSACRKGGLTRPDHDAVKDAFESWKAEIARAGEWLDALEEDDPGRDVRHRSPRPAR